MEGTLCGGISKVDDKSRHDEIVLLLHKHIDKLEGANWEVIEITNTREQVVGGRMFYCEGKFRDRTDQSEYEATVTIYERAWENFVQVKVAEKKKVE